MWFLLGDFNIIKAKKERKGINSYTRREEMEDFDYFISKAELIDLPLHGRRFIWSRSNGSTMSRLKKVLISEAWYRTLMDFIHWSIYKNVEG